MKTKNLLTIGILLIVIPALIVVGVAVFKEKYFAYLSALVVILSLIPIFYSFEKKENSSKELSVLAVLIALSAVGRFVFSWLPGFKPITAITIITAICLGKEAGFVVGSLSAVVSNFYFGQGPWTPFQMFAWGLIGFLAGVFAKPLKKNKLLLCLAGIIAGALFSLTMDIWTTVWADDTFNLSRYSAAVVFSLPLTAEYAVSNVIFLLLLSRPIGEKLDRIKIKHGLFIVRNKNKI
ncbi:MAG: ECF transporter S component [Oscillospiraceae bacterium]|nr:ECF transporter S component [Oscillospiraceae bacterium]